VTDDDIRALLAPRMRWRTRFLGIPRPPVPALRELPPATDDPAERDLIDRLDDAALPVYADWLEQHGEINRAHWIRRYPDGDFLSTRFGGTPAGLRGEPWPRCTCGEPLRFVGQVNGADAAAPTWFGLVTFFFCWRCCRYGEQDCGGADRPYRSWVVRAYPVAELDAFERIALPDLSFLELGPEWDWAAEFLFREGFVRGVREKSLPHYMHYADRILADDVPRLDRIAYEMTDRPGRGERALPMPRNSGLALGGYAYWYNGPDETPTCSACKQEMELLLQIDPHESVAAGWGDVGTLFIFVCERHRDMFALRMQCT
jgi:hypothetical protein